MCSACQRGGGGSHFCVRMGRMRDRQPPPEEASFSLLSPPPDSRALKTTNTMGKTRLRKGATMAPQPLPQGRSLSPQPGQAGAAIPPPAPRCSTDRTGNPVRAGGKGRQREEGVRRCDALNGAISFRDPTEKVVLCST